MNPSLVKTNSRWHLIIVSLVLIFLASGISSCSSNRTLLEFTQEDCDCYNRKTEGYTFKVDAHCHFRPFGGEAIPFPELVEYFERSGVLFVNAYGIGQKLPPDDTCTYYLDCPGTPVTPSLSNDFINAANTVDYHRDTPPEEEPVNIVLSMTFPDLANPAHITDHISLLDAEYPDMFTWMGEVNLVKQALLPNGHEKSDLEDIAQWTGFMDTLRRRGIPINIHCDLGNNENPTQFLHLMEKTLNTYPENKIVWSHMGLSKELSTLDPAQHVEILSDFLATYPNLLIDLSWDVLWDSVFIKDDARAQYVRFINSYPTRFLPGTDFVASSNKTYTDYKAALEKTSYINREMSDEAFRCIALGENYFRLLNLPHTAPAICPEKKKGKKR